ncbi:hypothetical protein SZ54_3888 [Rhizobium sp. UR51a]|nr:hypothetical protein SZ54_3888 [Rhizobium sp. UR51a]
MFLPLFGWGNLSGKYCMQESCRAPFGVRHRLVFVDSSFR